MDKKTRGVKAKEDLQLIALALENNQLAYEQLMNRYYSPIYYMILKLVVSMADAEELTQESFTKAFRNLEKYNADYPFSAWLFTIASNTTIDFLRRKKKQEIFVSEESNFFATELSDISQLSPEEDLIQKQFAIELKNKVKKLKERYRTLIELRYFDEYTYEEIAEELSLPMGTVKTQLFRAKNALLKSFRQDNL